MSEQSNDSNTSFKEELGQILDRYQFHFAHQFTHKEDPFTKDEALTSIINLVDKEVIKDDEVDFPENKGNYWTYPKVRNRQRAKQRAIIRGNNE